MAEVTTIHVEIESSGALSALQRLRSQMGSFDNAVNRSTREVKQFNNEAQDSFNGIKGAIAGAVAAFGGFQIAKGMVNTIREFERLNAVLETIEGSAEGGQRAFKLIQDFTATTPFQLEEVTKSYQILKTRGIEPTNEALRAYGNIAAGMGRSIEQFAEAVADAITGEFERLKEFGIKASKEGDNVSFTFQGITRTVKNNAEEINRYLMSIGQVNFAGALEKQAKTLNGVISNIQDQFSFLAYQIGEGGLRQALYDVAKNFAEVTKVGSETAKEIGSVLGEAVRVAGDAFIFLLEHAKEVSYVIGGFAAVVAAVKIGELATGLWAAAKATKAFTVALAANPIGLVAVGITTAAVATAKYSKETLEAQGVNASYTEILEGTWNVIKKKLLPVYDSIKTKFVEWQDEIRMVGDVFKTLLNISISTAVSIYDAFKYVGTKVAEALTAPLNWAIDQFQKVLDWVAPLAEKMGVEMVELGKITFEKFNEGAGESLANSPLVKKIKENYGRDWVGEGYEWGKNTAEGMKKGIEDSASGIVDEIVQETKRVHEENQRASQAIIESTSATEQSTQTTQRNTETKTENVEKTKEQIKAEKELKKERERLIEKLDDERATLALRNEYYGESETMIWALSKSMEAERLGILDNVDARIEQIAQLKEELRQKAFNSDFQGYIENLQFETRVLYKNREERERLMALRQWELKAQEQGTEITKEQREEFNRTWEAHQRAEEWSQKRDEAERERKRELKKLERDHQKSILETGRTYGRSADMAIRSYRRLNDSLTDMFTSLTGSDRAGSLLGRLSGSILGRIMGGSSSSSGSRTLSRGSGDFRDYMLSNSGGYHDSVYGNLDRRSIRGLSDRQVAEIQRRYFEENSFLGAELGRSSNMTMGAPAFIFNIDNVSIGSGATSTQVSEQEKNRLAAEMIKIAQKTIYREARPGGLLYGR